jgi:hypothetical protein
MRLLPLWLLVLQRTLGFSPKPIQSHSRRKLQKSKRSSFAVSSTENTFTTLPDLFPTLAPSLEKLGFSTPTPIQAISATKSHIDDENLLLIAPTGSGKTLAYLLPALSKAIEHDGTVLVVAPTRELAAQLMRDTLSLLSFLTEDEDSADELIALAIKGVALPSLVSNALVLIGTPTELVQVVQTAKGGYDFLAGDTLSAIILDEVDVLLPLAPKELRTALDGSDNKKGKQSNTPQDERRRQEQRRKLMTAKRKGTDIINKQVVSPTEKLLSIVASYRFTGENAAPPQVLAGSATASRKTLDRLNRALRIAAQEASSTLELVWAKEVKPCRPEEDEDEKEQQVHTIRAVTVPSQVKHMYISLDKESASSANAVLSAVAKAAEKLKPQTALVFLCGEFGRSTTIKAHKKRPEQKPKGATSKARRNDMLRQKNISASKQKQTATKSAEAALSARTTCSTLGSLGIKAQPLHVALGLEGNEQEDSDDNDDMSPFLVTFEGSARGLHLSGVDVVFVVGRPVSAASYLHLAGRVGRASVSDSGGVVTRPGTVVSLCTKGSATELEKWTRQIGGTALEELIL